VIASTRVDALGVNGALVFLLYWQINMLVTVWVFNEKYTLRSLIYEYVYSPRR